MVGFYRCVLKIFTWILFSTSGASNLSSVTECSTCPQVSTTVHDCPLLYASPPRVQTVQLCPELSMAIPPYVWTVERTFMDICGYIFHFVTSTDQYAELGSFACLPWNWKLCCVSMYIALGVSCHHSSF